MNTSAMTRIAESRRLKKGTGYAFCLLTVLTAGWKSFQQITNPEKPRGAVHTRTAIARRALELGIALNGSARLFTQPVLYKETIRSADQKYCSRNLWVVLCESENRQMNMLFDDKTGRLNYLIMDAVNKEAQEHKSEPQVETEAQAISISVARLKALQVLPPGAQIALRDKPHIEFKDRSWNINWLVRTTLTAQPYTIKIVLNRNSSLPTYMVNLEENI